MSDKRIIRKREVNLPGGAVFSITTMVVDGQDITRYEAEDGSLMCDATPDQVRQLNATLTHYHGAGQPATLAELFTAAGLEFTSSN